MKTHKAIKLVTIAAILIATTISIAVLLRSNAPELVRELRALPEVANVSYQGPADADLVVIHLRDVHFVPRELAALDGIDFDENTALVEKIQADELAIARFLIKSQDIRTVYSEGISKQTMPAYRLRLDIMRDLIKPDDRMSKDTRQRQRELVLEIGVPGRLLLTGEIEEVLPLDDADALDAAGPIRDGDGIRLDEAKVQARRQAMVANLPAEGLALIILGSSHDLGPHLGNDVLYIVVTPRSHPEN